MWLKHLTALRCLRQAAQTKSILQSGINGTGAAWNIPKVFLETMLNIKCMDLNIEVLWQDLSVKHNKLRSATVGGKAVMVPGVILLTVCTICILFAHLMKLYQPVAQNSIHTCAPIETWVCLVWGAGKMRILPSSTATHSMTQDCHRYQWNTSSCGYGWHMVLFMLTDASTAVSAVCSHTFINASLGDIYAQNAFQLKKKEKKKKKN